MKSVVVEASTVAKAIELAWHKADKPEEFFTRILQEHQSGFLGFGAQKAKIVLFFKNVTKSSSTSSATFPVLVKQKEYTHLFGNKDLKNPELVDVVDEQLNKMVQHKNAKPRQQHQQLQRKPQAEKTEKVAQQPIAKVHTPQPLRQEQPGQKQQQPKVEKQQINLQLKKEVKPQQAQTPKQATPERKHVAAPQQVKPVVEKPKPVQQKPVVTQPKEKVLQDVAQALQKVQSQKMVEQIARPKFKRRPLSTDKVKTDEVVAPENKEA